jgi:cellulose biosynthesis protein BcsQ
MALANVGWILASSGKRVLLIDWDLEAPGLHRYLDPFLDDPELVSSPGLIDFFVAFSAAASDRSSTDTGRDWFKPLGTLIPFTMPVRWDHFNDGGALELVPAGRQDAAYAVRATSFDWQHFYAHGGGIFLEEVKRQLRADYDYILIDSRTGISDTSGICTVQMPDQLVVLFTLNRQSISGAAAIADSANRQRRLADGRPSLTIWPVPTRVETGEKERLDIARETARWTFNRFLAHMPRDDRSAYWDRIEVGHQAYYAFDEVLAVFGDPRKISGSMVSAMEAIASLLTRPESVTFLPIPEQRRRDTLARFERNRVATTQPVEVASFPVRTVYISYLRSDGPAVVEIVNRLVDQGIGVWMDRMSLTLGDELSTAHAKGIDESAAMLYFISPEDRASEWREYELMRALAADKVVVPVLIGGATISALPAALRTRQAAIVGGPADIDALLSGVRRILETRALSATTPIDPDDPQKGRWGGQSRRFGRELRAAGRELSPGWFEIELVVASTAGSALTGSVQFHLHPTFAKPVVVVEAENGKAMWTLTCYGAFTVGAVADDGRTTLELDLSEVEDLPSAFREYR